MLACSLLLVSAPAAPAQQMPSRAVVAKVASSDRLMAQLARLALGSPLLRPPARAALKRGDTVRDLTIADGLRK